MIYIYPTETAYAIGCDATDQVSVDQIFATKNRSKMKTLPLIVADIDMAEAYVHITQHAQRLMDQYWPGPLTLVLEAKTTDLAEGIVAADNSIAIRVSSHEAPARLVQKIGKPIVSTSANTSGSPTCYHINEVTKQIDTTDMTIIDGGDLEKVSPSTTIDARTGLKLIRDGSIAYDTI